MARAKLHPLRRVYVLDYSTASTAGDRRMMGWRARRVIRKGTREGRCVDYCADRWHMTEHCSCVLPGTWGRD